ncbi:hypothetical protein RF11_14530 [Thelohanellus kitauei]|uniref:Uncharacterized protein n=1 Tax=Thelohanellus kitauei TaxID=669202 RepID=A0A0C2IV40_THEKT|nr:hypothetical protein RF11_14530 [Thelohanellus kitauei]
MLDINEKINDYGNLNKLNTFTFNMLQFCQSTAEGIKKMLKTLLFNKYYIADGLSSSRLFSLRRAPVIKKISTLNSEHGCQDPLRLCPKLPPALPVVSTKGGGSFIANKNQAKKIDTNFLPLGVGSTIHRSFTVARLICIYIPLQMVIPVENVQLATDTNAVAIKLPIFWTLHPEVRFTRTEAQFVIIGIVSHSN